MKINKIEYGEIYAEIPLTASSGKIRIKTRNSFFDYGMPTATRQVDFSQKHYVEWQIGYDVDIGNEEKLSLTSLPTKTFVGANGKTKALYELSEYLYFFRKENLIKDDELQELLLFLEQSDEKVFLETSGDFQILRTHPIEKRIQGISFCCSEVKYPLLVHRVENFEILVEIVIKEKQKAIGIQPMVYICFPVTDLITKDQSVLLGRKANAKEFAYLKLGKEHKNFILESFKIFGILSKNHNRDIINIIKLVLNDN